MRWQSPLKPWFRTLCFMEERGGSKEVFTWLEGPKVLGFVQFFIGAGGNFVN